MSGIWLCWCIVGGEYVVVDFYRVFLNGGNEWMCLIFGWFLVFCEVYLVLKMCIGVFF